MTLLVGVIMENWRSGKKETEKKMEIYNQMGNYKMKPTGLKKKKIK